jgi:hypothetical protein
MRRQEQSEVVVGVLVKSALAMTTKREMGKGTQVWWLESQRRDCRSLLIMEDAVW